MGIQPVIKIENLKRVYKLGTERVNALAGVSVEIYKGEICFLVGTSGSGKSTLLNMIAGLEKPTSGTVIMNGTHIEKLSERKLAVFRQKNLGFVFQSYNLLPTMNAVENAAMPLMFSGVKPSVREKAAKKMLQAVGLEKRMRHRPTQMSGGQQQRVAIARAFVSNPPIILADEPTGNLDSATTIEVMNMIVDLVRKNGQTLIVVTHEPELAVFGDRVLYIKDRKVERVEINENPVRYMPVPEVKETM